MKNYSGNILDPIHGIIRLSEIEKWVISQKLFSRLRNVRQNTFLYYVFPSANHTRFEHSLGVMFVASKIYEHCKRNYLRGNYKKEKYSLENTSEFDFFPLDMGDDEDIIVQELRLAALMHDIGHGPMSHKFDDFTLSKESLISIIQKDPDLNGYLDSFKEHLKRKCKVEHETISCLFILKILFQLKKITKSCDTNLFSPVTIALIEKIKPERVIKYIEPDFPYVEQLNYNNHDLTPFLSSIISSFPIDSDRMDYLFRDSYFTGVKYGVYDISRLFMSFVAIEYSNKIYLAIKESGIDSVIRFVQSRSHLFNQVYFHKTNRATNVMLDYACQSINLQEPIIDAIDFEAVEKFFWKNSDEKFILETLMKRIEKKEEKKVLKDLYTRKLWKRIYTKKIILTSNKEKIKSRIDNEIKNEIKTIESKLQERGIIAKVDIFLNKAFKDSKSTTVKILKKDLMNYNVHNDWEDFSEELKLLNIEVYMFRIYTKKTKSISNFNFNRNLIILEFKGIIEMLNNLT